MKAKPKFRNLEVISTKTFSNHLKRITFAGEDLEDFPSDFEGGYVKVILLQDKSDIEEGKRPKMRSYTVAEFDATAKTLSLDFTINYHDGHTASWAKEAQAGDKIVITGPGPRKLNNFDASKYIFFGDLTSINAVCSGINKVSNAAEIEVNLFVPGQEDIWELKLNKETSINWIIADERDYFTVAAKKSSLLDQDTVIFAAGEAKRIKSLRDYLTKERGLARESLFMSGYWREGLTDEQYRVEKHKYK